MRQWEGCSLRASATSAASVLLSLGANVSSSGILSASCSASSGMLWDLSAHCHVSDDQVELEQVSLIRSLEVIAPCPNWIRYRACIANTSNCIMQEEAWASLPAPEPIPYLAERVQLKLRPPYQPPFEQAGQDWAAALARALHFESNRFTVAEVSSTGAFVLLDVHPPHLYDQHGLASLGPRVSTVVDLLARHVAAPEGLVVGKHRVESAWGVWRHSSNWSKAAVRVRPEVTVEKYAPPSISEAKYPLANFLLIAGLVFTALTCMLYLACCQELCAGAQVWHTALVGSSIPKAVHHVHDAA